MKQSVLGGLLALLLGGCVGVSQAQQDKMIHDARETAYQKAYKAAFDESIKVGIEKPKAEEVAKMAGEEAANLAEEAIKKSFPVQEEGGLKKILGSVLYMAVQFGLAFVERKVTA